LYICKRSKFSEISSPKGLKFTLVFLSYFPDFSIFLNFKFQKLKFQILFFQNFRFENNQILNLKNHRILNRYQKDGVWFRILIHYACARSAQSEIFQGHVMFRSYSKNRTSYTWKPITVKGANIILYVDELVNPVTGSWDFFR
jgi:hypothetical protein